MNDDANYTNDWYDDESPPFFICPWWPRPPRLAGGATNMRRSVQPRGSFSLCFDGGQNPLQNMTDSVSDACLKGIDRGGRG